MSPQEPKSEAGERRNLFNATQGAGLPKPSTEVAPAEQGAPQPVVIDAITTTTAEVTDAQSEIDASTEPDKALTQADIDRVEVERVKRPPRPPKPEKSGNFARNVTRGVVAAVAALALAGGVRGALSGESDTPKGDGTEQADNKDAVKTPSTTESTTTIPESGAAPGEDQTPSNSEAIDVSKETTKSALELLDYLESAKDMIGLTPSIEFDEETGTGNLVYSDYNKKIMVSASGKMADNKMVIDDKEPFGGLKSLTISLDEGLQEATWLRDDDTGEVGIYVGMTKVSYTDNPTVFPNAVLDDIETNRIAEVVINGAKDRASNGALSA